MKANSADDQFVEAKSNDRTPLLRSASTPLPTSYSNLPPVILESSGTTRPSFTRSLSAKLTDSVSSISALPGLVRELTSPTSSQKLQKEGCCLCLEGKSAGLYCAEGHFICRDECFASLVVCICEESYKLKQSKGRILCPVPGCNSQPWSSKEIREGLTGHANALDVYTDTLVRLVSDDIETGSDGSGLSMSTIEPSSGPQATRVDRVKDMACDALTLKCPNPNCRLALDPNPDGCCSMQCVKCGCYFCWLCFTLTGLESSASHNHVMKCSENPKPNTLFLAVDQVSIVHKRRRLEAIRRALLALEGNSWQSSEVCSEAIDAIEQVLKDSEITKGEIFESTAIAPPAPTADDSAGVAPVVDLNGNIVPQLPQPPSLWRMTMIIIIDLILAGIGVCLNKQQAVYDFSLGVYRNAVIFISCWMGLLIGFILVTWAFNQQADNCREKLRAIGAMLIALVVLCAITALVIVLWEGIFFCLDYALAHCTGGSIMGAGYWHAGSVLIPYFSATALHIFFLVVSIMLRAVMFAVLEGRWADTEKQFALAINIDIIIVLCVAIYKDFGGDVARFVN